MVQAVDVDEGGVSDEVVARIPPIVDLDAHVVEPAGTVVHRLPARYREAGPARRATCRPAPRSSSGPLYGSNPGPTVPPVAWWCDQDHRYSVKRLIAAAGYPAEEIRLRGITFDQVRARLYAVPDRLADMDINGVQAQLCFPNYPRFCGQQFLWGKDRELARLCVEAYNDWMVEEWCGGAAAAGCFPCASSRCGMPVWRRPR